MDNYTSPVNGGTRHRTRAPRPTGNGLKVPLSLSYKLTNFAHRVAYLVYYLEEDYEKS